MDLEEFVLTYNVIFDPDSVELRKSRYGGSLIELA